MQTRRIQANGIEIAYETFGEQTDPPLVLVMGLGTQMIGWPEQFCRDLAASGFYVIRFDNRDIGESSHLDDLASPNVIEVALHRRQSPYSLDDMAADTLAFLDALGLREVHLVGASMGGFIAQTVALRQPRRIASLTLIMTSTGSRLVGYTSPKVLAAVLRGKPATSREAAIAASLAMYSLIGSPAYPVEAEFARGLAGQAYDRGYNPAGAQRQLAAVAVQPNRTRALGSITAPTLVMHGLHDPLVSPSGGIALARAIPGARFVGFHGMGHDLPESLWPDFIAEILAVTRRARPLGADE